MSEEEKAAFLELRHFAERVKLEIEGSIRNDTPTSEHSLLVQARDALRASETITKKLKT